uniref:Putative secreted protein n=1 Tax=Ixodes ricinus TaxID=34613 RepID=A0A6B0UDV1_IXORI
MKIERTPVFFFCCFFSLSSLFLSRCLCRPFFPTRRLYSCVMGFLPCFFFLSADCRSGDAKGKGPKKRQFFFCSFCLFESNSLKVILEMLLKKGNWRL